MNELDNIIKNSETEKHIAPSAQSWKRLEGLLHEKETETLSQKKQFSFYKITAVFILLSTISIAWFYANNDIYYTTEELVASADNEQFIEQIKILNNSYYIISSDTKRNISSQLN